MTSATATLNGRGILRHSTWDALPVTLALAHGALLLGWPSAPLVAVGLWWNANTVAHHFIHRPYFRPRALNTVFSAYLSVLLGVPQSLWRDRHLAHHGGGGAPVRVTRQMAAEAALVLALWGVLLVLWLWPFLTVYVPGYAAGLCLCWLQGHFEHARGTMSHYGWLYNLLFLNDGYHVEHHDHPGEHWTRLPRRVRPGASTSRWPAILRWLDLLSLEGLERLVLTSPRLQHFVMARHERAFRTILPLLPEARRVGIVGGALFPRTLLVLRRLLPGARFTVIDRSAANIDTARRFTEGDVEFVNGFFDPRHPTDFDLLVVPLAFVGDREALYQQPPAAAVVVHDWLWRARGQSAVVSLLLLKRLNLVRP